MSLANATHRVALSLIVFLAVLLICSLGPLTPEARGQFNHPGNILITDQFNNRVMEINPQGNVVWQFGGGPNNVGPSAIVGTNDAERVGTLTLMSGTGIPPGIAQAASACFVSGCVDNRVLLVNQEGEIVWQYGEFGVTGSGFNQLNVPVQNTFFTLPDGEQHVFITDQSNERIIEVRLRDKDIVWQYGTTGVVGDGPDQLSNPNAAELLDNGNVLISDENNNRAIEVTHVYGSPSTIVHTYKKAGGMKFSGVAFASRLPNGHTLITDSNNSRIVETDQDGHDFWHFVTNTRAGSNPAPLPTRAVQLANGAILISDQFNNQVIAVTHTTPAVIFAIYGTINTPGFHLHDANVMNAPYSAYVIGDYTGITPPN